MNAANGGQITRIRDIGRVELGAQTYSESFNLDGRPAAGIGIFLLPNANANAVADEVKAKMDELAKSFPQGLSYLTPYDTTKFVRAAINEVYMTLFEAGGLVLIVILVFLQDWRAMLVPLTTVPVTIIGAFAAMAALGFSINLATMFALVLAIGIVVDDAIVIVEGVSRYVEQGIPGRQAAERAMDELIGPIIGITLVLMAVFLPAAFLPGLTGELYRQFALVIAATALISAINAVTLKPTQSAMWLRPPVPPERRNVFYRGFNVVYDAVERGYARLIGAMTRHSGSMVVVAFAVLPPPIQGIGNVSGFTMQIELKNGNFDYALLESLANTVIQDGNAQSALQRLNTTFRADAPEFTVTVNRIKAETLGITVGNVFSALSAYVGSTYVNQINKFGQVFQVYTQALPDYRANADDIKNLKVAAGNGTMTPIGTVIDDVKKVVGPPLISLYNLYPSATIIGSAAQGFSSGQGLDIMDQIGAQALPRGTGYEWTAMSYQEKAVGSQIYFVFGLALLLVYFVLAGQYESWILPLAVILAVPLALLGVVGALTYLGAAANLYTQIGLVLLIALASKNAILIVEYARQQRAAGRDIHDAAVEAARLRFRPIIMTSFAFILGVFPLVIATGAGAASRRSIGIAVFSGMIASTCLAVVFVSSFYVVLQRFEERRRRSGERRAQPASANPADGAPSSRA